MNRKGSIIVVLLLTMSIIFMSSIYLTYLTLLQSKMSIASKDKIQSYYTSEMKINRILYDEDYYKEYLKEVILNHLKYQTTSYQNATINLDNKLDKNNIIKASFYKKDNRKSLSLVNESDCDGIVTVKKMSGTVINGLFEIGSIPLISYDLDFNTCKELDSFYKELDQNICLDDIPTTIKVLNSFDYEKIVLKTKNSSTDQLTKIRNGTEQNEDIVKLQTRDIFFVIKNKVYTPISMDIVQGNHYESLTLSGIIYLEGDLVINAGFNFTGILILKGVDSKIVVNTDSKPKFKGIILTEGDNSFIEKIDLKYDDGAIYKYGVYLPGFIDLRVK